MEGNERGGVPAAVGLQANTSQCMRRPRAMGIKTIGRDAREGSRLQEGLQMKTRDHCNIIAPWLVGWLPAKARCLLSEKHGFLCVCARTVVPWCE
eukprot:350667-Chlamydomonas_euryale.AAC.1